MGIYEGKVLKAFGDAVVRLPDDIAYALGTDVLISRSGDTVTIRPKVTPEDARANNQALVQEIRAIWAAAGGAPQMVGKREAFEAPDRSGLL